MNEKNEFLKTDSAFNFASFDVLKLRKYLQGHKGYIAGGCFKNIFKREGVKDIDIFFESEKDFNEAEKLFTSKTEYKEIYRNVNAVGFLDQKDNVAIDLVKSMFLPPGEMISLFDFTITKFALFSEEKAISASEDKDGFLFDIKSANEKVEIEWNVIFHVDFFQHLMLNRLVIDGDDLEFTLNTFERMLRYSKYGYSPCNGTKIKIVRAINQFNLPEDDDNLFRGFYNGID